MSYVNRIQSQFGARGLRVLGIHAPESEWERNLEKFAEAKRVYEVAFPSYFDRDGSFSFTLQSPGWPMIYIVDRGGQIRGEWFGEVHAGTSRAAAVEDLLIQLLEAN